MVRFNEARSGPESSLGLCFNSIVVRFNEQPAASGFEIAATFQFHSGSIQRFLPPLFSSQQAVFQFHSGSIQRPLHRVGFNRVDMFQFHSGSIQRMIDLRWIAYALASFNSIVVRFNGEDGMYMLIVLLRFNSIVVRFNVSTAPITAIPGRMVSIP